SYHAHVFVSRHIIGYTAKTFQQSAVILEWPRYKCNKAIMSFWFFRLYFSNTYQMFKTLFDGLDMSKHHSSRSRKINLMRSTHYIQPFLTTAFPFGNQTAYTVVQYFCSCTR